MFKKSLATFSSEIIILIVGIGTTIIINRGLGPTNKGYYSFILLLASTLSMVFEFGLSTGLSFFSGKKISVSIDKWKTFSLILTTIFFLLSFLATFFLLSISKYSSIYFVVPPLFFVLVSSKFTLGIFLGTLKIKLYNILRVLPIFVEMTLLLIFLFFKIQLSPLNVSLVYFSSIFLPFLFSIYFLFPLKFEIPSFTDIVSLSRYSFLIYLANLSSFLSYRIDMFLITFFLRPEYLGWYSVAVFIIEKTRLLSQSTSLINFALKINTDTKDSFDFTTRVVNSINILLSILVIISAYPAIILLYSSAYRESVIPMIILAPAILASGYSKMLSSELSADGIVHIQLFSSLFCLLINVALNLYFIPKLKIVGASISSLVSYSINAIILVLFFLKHYKKSIKGLLLVKREDLIRIKYNLKKI